jgi:hypothetical protein
MSLLKEGELVVVGQHPNCRAQDNALVKGAEVELRLPAISYPHVDLE